MTLTDILFKLIAHKNENKHDEELNFAEIKLILAHSYQYEKSKNLKELTINTEQIYLVFSEEPLTILTATIFHKKPEVFKLIYKLYQNLNLEQINQCLLMAARYNQFAILEDILKSHQEENEVDFESIILECVKMESYQTLKAVLKFTNEFEILVLFDPVVQYTIASKFRSYDIRINDLMQSILNFKKAIVCPNPMNNSLRTLDFISSALSLDIGFSLWLLKKFSYNINLAGQGLEHNLDYFQPIILKMAITYLKMYSKITPKSALPKEELQELLIELNAYDVDIFEESKRVFSNTEEKLKTLHWLEKGSSFEQTKMQMRERNISFLNTGSKEPNHTEEKTAMRVDSNHTKIADLGNLLFLTSPQFIAPTLESDSETILSYIYTN